MIREFGMKKWYTYTPVLLAGYGCEVGLVSMGTVSLALMSKAVIVESLWGNSQRRFT